MAEPNPQSPIAIVGVAALFPGSVNRDGFWRDILAGKDLITDVPPTHWLIQDYYDPDPRARDKTYSKRGAFLPEVDFDPIAWGVPPTNVPATDTTQLLALRVAQEVLEDACGEKLKDLSRERVSVILGVTSAQELLGSMVSRLQHPIWAKALREQGLSEAAVAEACDRIASHYVEWQESTFPGVLGNVVAGRIANRLDFGGTNCVTDAACASSLAALSMAVGELRLGDADLVICGGADTMNDIFMYVCFSKTPALSPTGDCRPFSDEADGTLLGEGIGMVALKRLGDAERDGDRIYAVIRGVGASSDGRSKSVYAPVPAGQARALRRAYAQAGYGPDTVELVEAHGTGTRAGDVAEFSALRDVFDGSGRGDRGWCALGSVKSQVGHTKAAAGVAGLFKAALALSHGVLPPTIKVRRPDPKLEMETSPFYLNTAARPWFRDGRHPRRASVSSFGFGGSNFHVTLEEYTGPGRRALRVRPAGGEMVLLSAASADDLAARCRELAGDAGRAGMLAYLARSTQESFDAGASVRLGVFADSEADLEAKLRKAADLAQAGREVSLPGGVELVTGPATREVAFLFPGQGSQYVGMGADVCMAIEAARKAWDTLPSPDLGPDEPSLQEVVFPRPAFDEADRERQRTRLTATEWAQPGIGAASLALLDVLQELGVRPFAVAGHSFGEVSALYAAGALSRADFLKTARRRGELMAEVARVPGAMLSVAGRIADVEARLLDWGLDVVVANYNSPNQLVLSGSVDGIAEAERRLAELGVATTRLAVATAFHSKIVDGACGPFRAFLDGVELSAPAVDVYSTGAAAPYPAAPDAMRDQLARQIAEPVRFVDQIEALYARGIRVFVEVGPGNVLTNLVGHILKGRGHRAIALDRKGRTGLSSLNEGLGQLSLAGVPVAYDRLWADFAPAPDPRASARPGMVLKIGGSCYAKPYPAPGAVASSTPTAVSPKAPSAPPAPQPEPPRAPAAKPPAPASVPAVAAAVAMSAAPPRQNGAAKALPAVLVPVHAVERTAERAPERPPAAADPAVEIAWVHAFQEAQRQTAESHASFQRTMAETHSAFLRSSEASLGALVSLLRGTPLPALSAPGSGLLAEPRESVAELTAVPVMPMPAPAAVPAVWAAAAAASTMEPPPAEPPALAAITPPPVAQPISAPAPAPPAEPAPAAVSPAGLQSIMLKVLAERTGYPEEMLSLDMDLEADLGVDSIKRVEILAAVQELVPALPAVRPAQIASKRTLREIVAHFEAALGTGADGNGHDAPGAAGAPAPAEPPAAEPPPAVTHDAAAAPAALLRSVVRAVESPAPGLGVPGILGPGRVVVTDDGAGVASALVARLAAAGVDAAVQQDVPPDAGAVIFLGGLRPVRDLGDAMAVNRAAFQAARTVAPRFAVEGGTFVTVQDTGGDFGLRGADRAWLGGLSGLVKTAALEWPAAHVRALDLECARRPAAALADAIWNELLTGGTEREIGLPAAGGRLALRAQPAPLNGHASGSLSLSADSVIVASGGARGITADCLVAIAEAARCRFLVLGRTPLADEPESCRGIDDDAGLKRALLADLRQRGQEPGPAELGRAAAGIRAGREIRRTLAAIRAAGGEPRYQAVDVTDAGAVASAVAEARAAWGPVTGVVHGAGVLADKLIGEKTDAQFDLVFGTKVLGMHALLEATRQDDLRFLLLFSSIAARLGNPGQADYAMANEVLNKVAALEQQRRGSRCLVRALGWGPWNGGMVDEGLRRHFADKGLPLIPVPAGARQCRDELAAGAGQGLEVVVAASEGRDAASAAPAAYDVLVDRTRYPFLDGHRVRQEPVVPVALVLEWFARAVRAHWPEASAFTFRQVRVLRGIRLEDFERGERCTVRIATVDEDGATLRLELVGSDGRRHYSAVAERPAAGERRGAPAPPAAGEPWPAAIYGQQGLFHGPGFQVLRDVETSPRGLVASVAGAGDEAWPGSFLIDPALLDGGLQLALMWTRRRLGGASLPTSIEAVHVDATGATRGPTRCILEDCETKGDSARMDVVFVDGNGRSILELRGVVTHLLPESEEAAVAVHSTT
jgi:acyl transferase domain-containing protein